MFERLVVATERIATAMEGATVTLQVADCAAAGKGKKGKRGEDAGASAPTAQAVEVVKIEAVAGAEPAKLTSSFLDVEESTVEEKPVLTIDIVRKALIGLQKALDPDTAFKVLVKSSGCQTLQSIPVDKYAVVMDAIAEAMPRKAA